MSGTVKCCALNQKCKAKDIQNWSFTTVCTAWNIFYKSIYSMLKYLAITVIGNE